MKTLVVGHEEVVKFLPMAECIALMERTFRALHHGQAVQPLRSTLLQPDKRGILATMPAYLGEPKVIGSKVITVFSENRALGLDSHQGIVVIHDTENGRLLAVIDAGEITAIRTAAASAVATKWLSRDDASVLAILGSGTQATLHLAAMLEVRPIKEVRVWSRTPAHAIRFAQEEAKKRNLSVTSCETVAEAVKGADIICTTTLATAPILEGRWIDTGAHINAVGASVPSFRELDVETIVRSRLFVDRMESVLNEADDFRIPHREGVVSEAHILGELGAVLEGDVPGRESAEDITLFKSLGLAVEDLAAAHYVYQRVQESGRGTWIEFSGARHA